jgi:Zn-dependent protease with chaperone function
MSKGDEDQEQLAWDHSAVPREVVDLISQKLASRERRQVGAVLDTTVVFGLAFAFQYALRPSNSGFWIALGSIWFLTQVPPIALWGRTVGHRLCNTRVVTMTWLVHDLRPWWRLPGWWRSLMRWLLLVPGVVANRFGGRCPHDAWTGTFVVFDPVPSTVSGRLDSQAGRWLALAQELDELSRTRPRRYRLRVALLAAAGYGFILALALIQIVGAAAVVIFIVRGSIRGIGAYTWPFVLVSYGFAALSSLWMDQSVPPGTVLSSVAAPRLTRVIDEVRARLRAPRVHLVVLDSSANAGVIEQPMFGPIGPTRNVLLVGLPLLQTLPLSEFRAVLAHELAHLVRRHGCLAAWIHRLRQAYPDLLERLGNKGWTATIVRVFFDRYTPYFIVSSLALARSQEYEADRLAAEIATPEALAAALRRCSLLEAFLAERHGTSIDDSGTADDDEPKGAAWEELLDTHPPEARRLAALGARQQGLSLVRTSAAAALLPADLDARLEPTAGLSSTDVQAFAAFTSSGRRD